MNKNIRNYIFIAIFTVLIVPQVTFAAWWNPLGWFDGWTFQKKEPTSQVRVEPQKTYEEKITELQKQVDDSCEKKISNKFENIKQFATFEDYPIENIYEGKISPLDISSSFIASRFKTTINEALKNGVNFAGHYIIAEWGFTGIGREFAVVDAITGKAYPFPYVANMDFEYKKDSNLIIVDPIWLIQEIAKNTGCINPPLQDLWEVRPYYFLWENNSFKLLGPNDNPSPVKDITGRLNT